MRKFARRIVAVRRGQQTRRGRAFCGRRCVAQVCLFESTRTLGRRRGADVARKAQILGGVAWCCGPCATGWVNYQVQVWDVEYRGSVYGGEAQGWDGPLSGVLIGSGDGCDVQQTMRFQEQRTVREAKKVRGFRRGLRAAEATTPGRVRGVQRPNTGWRSERMRMFR
jgi:hypothetical protein